MQQVRRVQPGVKEQLAARELQAQERQVPRVHRVSLEVRVQPELDRQDRLELLALKVQPGLQEAVEAEARTFRRGSLFGKQSEHDIGQCELAIVFQSGCIIGASSGFFGVMVAEENMLTVERNLSSPSGATFVYTFEF